MMLKMVRLRTVASASLIPPKMIQRSPMCGGLSDCALVVSVGELSGGCVVVSGSADSRSGGPVERRLSSGRMVAVMLVELWKPS